MKRVEAISRPSQLEVKGELHSLGVAWPYGVGAQKFRRQKGHTLLFADSHCLSASGIC